MLLGLMIEESGCKFEVAIEGGDSREIMLLWLDAFALEVVFHRGNGVGGKCMVCACGDFLCARQGRPGGASSALKQGRSARLACADDCLVRHAIDGYGVGRVDGYAGPSMK